MQLTSAVVAAAFLPSALALRQFAFVAYGSTFDGGGRAAITCDGNVKCDDPAVPLLQCTHWTGNETPEEIYADTSTEIALNLAAASGETFSAFDDAFVINNHFDTDGVLSCWACLEPTAALKHRELLIAGAAAGDFGEWSSDAGVKLDLAVSAIGASAADDEDGYSKALAALPTLLEALDTEGEPLYRDGWREALESWNDLEGGRARVTGEGSVAVVHEPPDGRISAYALHRALSTKNIRCSRVLRVASSGPTADGASARYRYELEKPGHGWVQRLATRTPVPPADGAAIAAGLSERLGESDEQVSWVKGGSSGLVAICRTAGWVTSSPETVLEALAACDAAGA